MTRSEAQSVRADADSPAVQDLQANGGIQTTILKAFLSQELGIFFC